MNGPGFWKSLLQDFETVNRGAAAIAGGCVRDWMLGLAPKDIDIFYRNDDRRNMRVPAGWVFDPDGPQYNHDDYLVNHANDVAPIVAINDFIVNDTKVQCIQLQGGVFSHVEAFDINITKGYFDNGSGLIFPPEMLGDLENKTVTVRKDSDRSRQRAQRFIEKVGAVEEGWRMVEDYPAPVLRHRIGQPQVRQGLVFERWAFDEL